MWDLLSLIRNFGKAGKFYYDIARGIDNRRVETESERKSIGTELTYEKDLRTQFEIIAELYKLERELMERIENAGVSGRTLTLKVKFPDFRQITRSKTLPFYIKDFGTLHREVTSIRKSIAPGDSGIRLLGVSISNLETEDYGDKQLTLFDVPCEDRP